MAYLFDSDQIIEVLDRAPGAVALMAGLAAEGIAISVVTYMEVYHGALRSGDPGAIPDFYELAGRVSVLPFSVATARVCAELRERLARDGHRVRGRALDLMNAAIALEHGLTLVTRNTRDYADIPGLDVFAPTGS